MFSSQGGGRFKSSDGDYGELTQDPNGPFQLKEKNGFIYRFRNDFKLDYVKLDYVQDRNGNQVMASYDANDYLVTLTHSGGAAFHLDYDESGRLIRLTDHAGRVTTYAYDSNPKTPIKDQTPRLGTPWKLYGDSVLIKVTDPAGAITQYNYETGRASALNWRLNGARFPDGTNIHYQYNDDARIVYQTGTWGANPIKYDYTSDDTLQISDAVGSTVIVKADENQKPLSVTGPDGGTTYYDYDTAGNRVKKTDPLEQATYYTFDEKGNIASITYPDHRVTTYGYDLSLNLPVSMVDQPGNLTIQEYDINGNLIKLKYPDGSVMTNGYDKVGNLKSSDFWEDETETLDKLCKRTKWDYDNQGQITSVTDAVTDALGYSTQFTYDTRGDMSSVINARGDALSMTRNTLGQLTRRTYVDGSHEDYEYDASGKTTAHLYFRESILL